MTLSTVWYGDCRNSPSEIPTDRLFTGQRYDDTGLYYYGARYYDPEIGRFISPDTIIPNPADPQSFNRYSYCLNNPLKYIDPSGHVVMIHGYDARYLHELSSNQDLLALAVANDPNLAEAISSNEYKAHLNNLESNQQFATNLEKSEEVFGTRAYSDSVLSTNGIIYQSENSYYDVDLRELDYTKPKVDDGWYLNLNGSVPIPILGLPILATGGVMINDDGLYGYGGGGIGIPGVFLSVGNTDPTLGWNFEVSGNAILGWTLGGAIDFENYLEVIGMYDITEFQEWNVGTPGISATIYHVWEWISW